MLSQPIPHSEALVNGFLPKEGGYVNTYLLFWHLQHSLEVPPSLSLTSLTPSTHTPEGSFWPWSNTHWLTFHPFPAAHLYHPTWSHLLALPPNKMCDFFESISVHTSLLYIYPAHSRSIQKLPKVPLSLDYKSFGYIRGWAPNEEFGIVLMDKIAQGSQAFWLRLYNRCDEWYLA